MIELDVVDRIGVVRPAHGKVNALNLELCRAITRTVRDLDDQDAFRAVFDLGKPMVPPGCRNCGSRAVPPVGPGDHAVRDRAGGPHRAVFDGANHGPEEALALGLVTELCDPDGRIVAFLNRTVGSGP
ncbi:hypothetical protein [Saccharothrix luteola]|uniref:hypothetical protein n=1 Tax=Saccharothrix luteola TaxID=2893018 RepID=UPI001E5A5EE9|nr:hypothetical protein [Saccharothrix luteola]MCC8243221.1 hypothetical protein [Saccharothrix luteola]